MGRCMMMLALADLARFLEELDGTGHPLILVRDPTTDSGWRLVTMEDLQVLWERLTARADKNTARSNQLACYNLKEAARLVGVSTSKMQTWLNRRDNPIPHIKDGRKIFIPGFQLMVWLKEESARNIGRTRTS